MRQIKLVVAVFSVVVVVGNYMLQTFSSIVVFLAFTHKYFSVIASGTEKMTSDYLITVITGNRKGAGTDASVSLVIKGCVSYIAYLEIGLII